MAEESGIFTSYRSEIDNPKSLSSDLLTGICIDDSGFLWIGTQGGGLNLFDPELKIFTRYLISGESPENLRSNIISFVFEDSKNQIWIGSEWGLYKFRRENGQFEFVDLLSNNDFNKVSSIFEDKDGILWVGVEGRGLIRFDSNRGQIKHYNLNFGPMKHEFANKIRALYVEVLIMKGHIVSSFPSAEEALAEWKMDAFKLIICDLGLPGMNGWEFISKIREMDSYIPIIILTGWGNEIGEERAKELDVQKVLAKPVSLEELMKTINEFC